MKHHFKEVILLARIAQKNLINPINLCEPITHLCDFSGFRERLSRYGCTPGAVALASAPEAGHCLIIRRFCTIFAVNLRK